ncbi:MAG TPA: AAA family ATPase, partial [Candidatus Limnocylindrales bacterium]|nr:AAA family ATPase [Candidatus Limnocylindrales bacterium]
MVACPNCGTENAAGSRFCNNCGAPLGAPPTPVPEERKVVSALFCDLVGFTATSEGADPEDVDRMLTTYFTMARSQVEAFGGVVEKFIGDAVLGVFGVPAAHEDDPERAVRAALRICEEAADLRTLGDTPLRLRVGVNTGEVLVRLGVAPGSGERFLAGDTINTASRIQSVAPEMGVAVGFATYAATKAIFEYLELPPAVLKGKAEPVRVFQPTASRARLGVDLTRTHDSAYVGREVDLALLKGLFDKSVSTNSVQLVTIVGEPGIGKTRIVAELLAHAQSREPGLTWRQGRCLPYGDGVTFWALGEIVKAQAGILESDDPAVAGAKIDDAVPAGPDRDWLRQRLRPLVGVDVGSSAERDELFAAWRTFLEEVAEAHPTVLVFEDIHWADDAMLAFLEHLADRAQGVPLLVVATARPELFERHPTFAGGLHNVDRINVARLSDVETGRLVAGLLGAVVPPELQDPILERAEGNPLYAEEFVRLLRDRDLLVDVEGAVALRPGAVLPLPDSIGALIAARLDTLGTDSKAMLADAAVVGKVFWAGAVATMGGREVGAVIDAMRELARKELVRQARHSSMAGETEYAFWHVLARDVAYAQLPRPSRAARHIAAARWLEGKAGERAEDVAEVLAHHWATALELSRASRQTDHAASLEPNAIRYLLLAGDKAMNLDVAAAVASFERALALTPAGHEQRPVVLARFGQAAREVARYNDAAGALEEAIASFLARGDHLAAARAMFARFGVLQSLGDPRQWTVMPEALALLEPLPPSQEIVDVLGRIAGNEFLQGRYEEALRTAERALTLAQGLGQTRPSQILRMHGIARISLGHFDGFDDLRDAIALGIEAGGRGVPGMYGDLASLLAMAEGPATGLQPLREGISFAKARGLTAGERYLTCGIVNMLYGAGEHDEALRVAEELLRQIDADDDISLLDIRTVQTSIAALRGKGEMASGPLDWIEATARQSGDPQLVVSGLVPTAVAHAALGDGSAARRLLAEVEAYPGARENTNYPVALPSMVRTALRLGDRALAERLVAGSASFWQYARHATVAASAALAEADGDLEAAADGYADAADRWRRFGVVEEEGFALLGQGRCLISLSRPADADPVLLQARSIFERLQ